MGKIALVSAKYIIHVHIQIEGVVDRPDVIGAVFGQTEGLLGADLELRELQRSGRIGRIEVNTETRSGKTSGDIIVPSSLDKAETSIIAAALETIQRIGPCNSKITTQKIEDVRVSKRSFVVERAKELLSKLTNDVLPDSVEITEEVANSVRMMEIMEYGKDRLPAGPNIDDSEEIIIVEGRADVLNLLKHGIKNCISLNGTNIPETIVELGKKKTITLFVDGDRGGDLIIKELSALTDLDYVVKAPDGKEVEEITKKEIHKALRGRIAFEQAKMEIKNGNGKPRVQRPAPQRPAPQRSNYKGNNYSAQRPQRAPYQRPPARSIIKKPSINPSQKKLFKEMMDDLVGTRGAYILDDKMNILGKVPTIELSSTIRNIKDVSAVVFDGTITTEISTMADKAGIKYVVGRDSKVGPTGSRASLITNLA